MLTPEEFVEAGDLLVYKCPGWQWEGGDPKKAVSYLPPNKQYLVTRGVPCEVRASTLEAQANQASYVAVDVDGDDGWFCGMSEASGEAEEVPEADPDVLLRQQQQEQQEKNDANNDDDDDDDDDSDIPDMAS